MRTISESILWSTTWLMTAADEAASQIPREPKRKAESGTMPGVAMNMPTMAVKTMSATMRGLHSTR